MHAVWDAALSLWATVESMPEYFTDIYLALIQKCKLSTRGFFMHHLVPNQNHCAFYQIKYHTTFFLRENK